MIFEINKIDSRKLPLKSLQSKSKARRSHPWLFQSLSKPQVYLVTHLKTKGSVLLPFLYVERMVLLNGKEERYI